MAMGVRFTCSQCGNSIDAWDEGDPYYLDAAGKKVYAYHPSPERDLCIGVESPHLCLSCGAITPIDSLNVVSACSTCGSGPLASTFHLDGRDCPACHKGVFLRDDYHIAIS